MKSTILGCPFDNGIRSMLRFGRGITGAADGPSAVFKIFSEKFTEKYHEKVNLEMLPLSQYNLDLTDIYDIEFRKAQKKATLEAHDMITAKVKQLCEEERIVVSVGGDHSITYPVYKGLFTSKPGKRIGVIYVDAHFDMRPYDPDQAIGGVISSGNAFRRILEDSDFGIAGQGMAVIGINNSGTALFRELDSYAKHKNVMVVYDTDLADISNTINTALENVSKVSDHIHLSIDIDAVNKMFAPGVSCPAEKGITAQQLYTLVGGFSKHSKVISLDVAETSSRSIAWSEAVKNKLPRQETSIERLNKLKKTAELGANVINCFLENKLS